MTKKLHIGRSAEQSVFSLTSKEPHGVKFPLLFMKTSLHLSESLHPKPPQNKTNPEKLFPKKSTLKTYQTPKSLWRLQPSKNPVGWKLRVVFALGENVDSMREQGLPPMCWEEPGVRNLVDLGGPVHVVDLPRWADLPRWYIQIWRFSKIVVPPNHPILIGFSIINHPFWSTPIVGHIHIRWWPCHFFQGFTPETCGTISKLTIIFFRWVENTNQDTSDR